jgi:hypothetical protein
MRFAEWDFTSIVRRRRLPGVALRKHGDRDPHALLPAEPFVIR